MLNLVSITQDRPQSSTTSYPRPLPGLPSRVWTWLVTPRRCKVARNTGRRSARYQRFVRCSPAMASAGASLAEVVPASMVHCVIWRCFATTSDSWLLVPDLQPTFRELRPSLSSLPPIPTDSLANWPRISSSRPVLQWWTSCRKKTILLASFVFW